MRDIGKNIKALRIQKNMTQNELAEKLFVTRQTVSNYETGRSRPDVEMLAKIAEVLETDANAVIYGSAASQGRKPVSEPLVGSFIVLLLLLLRKLATPYISVFTSRYYVLGLVMLVYCLLDPLIWFVSSWTITRMMIMAIRKGPLKHRCIPHIRRIFTAILILWMVISVTFLLPNALDDYLYSTQQRGIWADEPYESNGETLMGKSWQRIPLPFVEWIKPIGIPVAQFTFQYPWSLGPLGIVLCLCGFPKKQD